MPGSHGSVTLSLPHVKQVILLIVQPIHLDVDRYEKRAMVHVNQEQGNNTYVTHRMNEVGHLPGCGLRSASTEFSFVWQGATTHASDLVYR